MEEKTAEKLIEELKRHPNSIKLDESLFLPILINVNIDKSKKFQEELQEQRQFLLNEEMEYYFSLRRIILNRNAKNYQLKNPGRLIEYLSSKLTAYSSDNLCRTIRANSYLVGMMEKCEEPFSLLGKLQVYDSSKEGILSITTSPILVIPNVKDKKQIYGWETASTTYEEKKSN